MLQDQVMVQQVFLLSPAHLDAAAITQFHLGLRLHQQPVDVLQVDHIGMMDPDKLIRRKNA